MGEWRKHGILHLFDHASDHGTTTPSRPPSSRWRSTSCTSFWRACLRGGGSGWRTRRSSSRSCARSGTRAGTGPLLGKLFLMLEDEIRELDETIATGPDDVAELAADAARLYRPCRIKPSFLASIRYCRYRLPLTGLLPCIGRNAALLSFPGRMETTLGVRHGVETGTPARIRTLFSQSRDRSLRSCG